MAPSALSTFVYLTLPHLARPITVVILIETIFLLTVFAEIFVTTGGGPGLQTTNIAFLIYSQALIQYDVGSASAGGLVAVVIANIVAFFLVRDRRPEPGGRRRHGTQGHGEAHGGVHGRGVAVRLPDLLPILWMVLTSFKTELEAFTMPPSFLFFHWTTENYATVQERSDYLHHALNSIIIAGGSTLIALLIAVPAAMVDGVRADQAHQGHPALDAVDQDDAAGRRAGADLPDLPRFRPARHPQPVWSCILCLGNLPIVVWMLFTYFKEIPSDILEAARMDGATIGRELIYVLTPMAVPGLASTLLLNLILAWNEAFWTLNLSTLRGGAAHRVHRLLFESRGPVLGEAVGGVDARDRPHPRPRLVHAAAARPRPDLRRGQIGAES